MILRKRLWRVCIEYRDSICGCAKHKYIHVKAYTWKGAVDIARKVQPLGIVIGIPQQVDES